MLTWSGDDVIWYAIPHLVSWSHRKIETTSDLGPGFVQKIGTGLALLDRFVILFDFDLFHWNMAWRPPWVHRRCTAPWSFQWRGDAAMLTKNRAERPERVRSAEIEDFIWFHKSRGQILLRTWNHFRTGSAANISAFQRNWRLRRTMKSLKAHRHGFVHWRAPFGHKTSRYRRAAGTLLSELSWLKTWNRLHHFDCFRRGIAAMCWLGPRSVAWYLWHCVERFQNLASPIDPIMSHWSFRKHPAIHPSSSSCIWGQVKERVGAVHPKASILVTFSHPKLVDLGDLGRFHLTFQIFQYISTKCV